jgi:hypothetical protein
MKLSKYLILIPLLIVTACLNTKTDEEIFFRDVKALTDSRLVAVLHKKIAETDSTDQKMWDTLSMGLCELYVRPYAKDHEEEIDLLRKEMQEKSHLCVVDGVYSLEVVGVQEKRDKKRRVHPYPRSHAAKYVIEEWQESTIEAPLDRYIDEYISALEKKKLLHKKVNYLSRSARAHYVVTFEQASFVRIGGKAAEDGEYIFVLDSEGKTLYAAKKKKGKFQHTSFLAGKPVLCAGVFTLQNEKITRVYLSSGHYKPPAVCLAHIRQFLETPSRLHQDEIQKIPFLPHSE